MTIATCLLTQRAACAELSWDASSGCPDHEEVMFRIERALGSSLLDAGAARFAVQVQRSRAGFSAQLTVEGDARAEGKQRTLSAPDCAQLADAVAVAIALALGTAGTPEPAPSSSPPVVVASPEPDTTPPPPTDASPAPVSSFSAWLLGDSGTLPGLGAGAALGAELGWSRLQLRALALLLFEQHVDRAGQAGLGPDAGADLALFAASVSACAATLGSFREGGALFLCAGPELGRLSGRGTGVSEHRTGGGLWLAPRVDLGGLWRVPDSNVELGLIASAAAPLLRDDFVLEGSVPVHRASSLLGRLALGVSLTLD